MTTRTRRKIYIFWRRQIRPLLVLILIFTAARSIILDWNDVPTGSMRPTIIEGDRIFVNKLAYSLKVPYTAIHLIRWGEPKRGEIIVFYNPKTGVRLVKRVVGVPGDTIAWQSSLLVINGKPLEYEDLDAGNFRKWLSAQERASHGFFTEKLDGHPHAMMRQSSPRGTYSNYNPPIVLKPGEFWVMGDNRDNSADSREFGPVPLDGILGRSSRIMFSLDYDKWLMPRWSRWFKGLP